MNEAQQLVARLTPRERDVLIITSKGEPRARVAELLGMSKNTAHWHLRQVHAKFDVGTDIECAVIAAKAGIL